MPAKSRPAPSLAPSLAPSSPPNPPSLSPPHNAGAHENSLDSSPESREISLSLEDLAQRSGVSVRTIRYYQAEKLLPRPERDKHDARIARYPEAAVERLRLIGELSDRGLKLPAIRDLLGRHNAEANVAQWLGLDASLRGGWGTSPGRLVSDDELTAMLQRHPKGTRADLEHSLLIVRQGNSWFVRDSRLLDITLDLIARGVHADAVSRAGLILQTQLRRAAEQLVELFLDELADGLGAGTKTAELIAALRPVAGEAAQLIFASELETAVNALLSDTKRLTRR